MPRLKSLQQVFVGFVLVLIGVALTVSVYTGFPGSFTLVTEPPKKDDPTVPVTYTIAAPEYENDKLSKDITVDSGQELKIVKYHEFYNFSLTHPFENDCKYPFLLPVEPDIEPNVRHYRRIDCKHNSSGVIVEQLISGDIIASCPHGSKHHKGLKCRLIELSGTLKRDRGKVKMEGPWMDIPFNERITVNKNNFMVKCVDKNDNEVFKNVYAGVKEPENPPRLASENPNRFGVNILVFDSTARAQFLRHMPESVEFMKRYNFSVLYGHTKVGDNSAINLVPLLSGRVFHAASRGLEDRVRPDQEIPSNQLKQDYWEKSEFLIQQMRDAGCATLWNDDIGNKNYGLLNYYQFNGFAKPPAEYYYRPFYAQIYNSFKTAHTCIEHDFLGRRYIEIWERFASRFHKNCHFAFNFFTALTHNKASDLELYDRPLANSFARLASSSELFQNSFVFVMGDHGQRIEPIQRKYTGRIEERMPMVGIFVPQKFRETQPEKYQNLVRNQNRLTSNFDLHDTLREILGLPEHSGGPVGQSLFKEVPTNRNCKAAHVPENFCVCMENAGPDWLKDVETDKLEAAFKETTSIRPSCVENVVWPKAEQLLKSVSPFTINWQARLGIRYPKDGQKVKESDKKEPSKLADLEFNGDVIFSLKNATSITVSLIARVRWDKFRDSYHSIAEPLVLRPFKATLSLFCGLG
ncbi:unnamed protein product [Bursaphelenchus xylophilus]|uniref:(pine wood nematode) hypothetical protein n=1 Tax=Bursaphelenchus xylophilus TaxID=6326 RepID=A0A1I7S4M7_BURXY|nr:unnamed protein product [Bursaphelenchus xylophilus]CAG9117241.1 unnamed protein product [Bursaphelenchus xylophilus]